MKKEVMNKWVVSSYNEDTEEELNYYLSERKCDVGDIAYLYSHETQELTELDILRIIHRADDNFMYDQLVENEDILLDGERYYQADTSAEFIMDTDSCLVWFRYGKTIPVANMEEFR